MEEGSTLDDPKYFRPEDPECRYRVVVNGKAG
jgi:hypothetical protein